MNIAQVEQNLQSLIKSHSKDTFIYDLLLAYGLPKASVTRLQKGNLNLSKEEGVVSWKKKVLFKPVFQEDLHLAITKCKEEIKQEQRFIIVTDYKTLLAVDTKTNDTLDIDFNALPKHFDFFLPWAGMEKATHQSENPADVKAAEKMAKLFDEIKKDNPDNSPEFIHGLNVFLSRLLFCFFAEDTNIFQKAQFTNAISSHTQNDGSDLSNYLDKLFEVMNLPSADKSRLVLPAYLNDFPYVNGGLFQHKHTTPTFTRRSRQAVIDAGDLNWSAINPDIFGSMIQAVITPEHRGGLGMHYTSVPNIMKVIEPLFLNDLNEEFENAKYEPKKLNKLLERLGKIKIFDPACGSGNFLIIAYKELRFLEIKILLQLQDLQKAATGFEDYQAQLELIPKAQLSLATQYQPTLFSRIELAQFFGIEIDDFAHEIAILSLWLAQHQMNQKFKEVFGNTNPTLPLQAGGNIIHGNATRVDWEVVCPKKANDEIYILGNPPYLGQRNQKEEHQDDMSFVFNKIKNYKNLDYISIWFYKASNYIDTHSKFAFVTTNSLCQGTQVEMLWPMIFSNNQEIFFAYKNIKWTNNAKDKAGVTVSIIGIRTISNESKYLIEENRVIDAKNINAYLINGSNIIVANNKKPISKLNKMEGGNQPREGGHFILSDIEKNKIIGEHPNVSKYIRPLIGSIEFINNTSRWCIWINESEVEEASTINLLKSKIDAVKLLRTNGNTLERNFINVPYRFIQNKTANNNLIIIPVVSSESRDYIPIGFLQSNYIVLNSANVIFDPEVFNFSILCSKIHNIWVKSVAGKLENRIRYTNGVCWNSFPFPKISEAQKQELTQSVFRILEERENHSEKTLAQLYDPDKMPQGLREAHRLNDLAVERCYRSKPFENDDERLEYLFKLYEKMIAEEKTKDTLFQEEKKAKKTRVKK